MATLSFAKPVYDDISRDQLELLKAKFDVLQGERKAYFETYEQTKRTNEQLARDLRERQKELSRQLAEAQKKARNSQLAAKNAANAPGGVGSDDSRVGEDLIKKRTEYDKLRHQTAALKVEFDRLQGELTAVRNMSGVVGAAAASGIRSGAGSRRGSGGDGADSDGDEDDLDRMSGSGAGGSSALSSVGGAGAAAGAGSGATPIQRRVRLLENRLDKTAIKHEEALSIRRTYEGIVKRLRDERVSYDTQIAALEKTIASKAADHGELQVLVGEATRAMEASQIELTRVRSQAASDREKRARELRERDAMARARRHQAEVALARERARRDLLAEVAGDLGVSEEKALINNVETAKAQKVTLGEHAALIKRKLEAYEAAWRRVKDATGVGEIGEVTSKMAGQVEQHSQLTTLSRDNSARLEGTREEIEAFRRFVEELRYTGGAGVAANGKHGNNSSSNLNAGGSDDGGDHQSDGDGGGGARPRMALSPPGAAASLHTSPSNGLSSEQSTSSAFDVGSANGHTQQQQQQQPPPHMDFRSLHATLTSKAERARDESGEASMAMMEIRVGSVHLADRLAVVRASAGAPPLQLLPPSAGADEDDSAHHAALIALLAACGHTLVTIADRLTRYRDMTGVDLLTMGEGDVHNTSGAAAAGGGDEHAGGSSGGAGGGASAASPVRRLALGSGAGGSGSPASSPAAASSSGLVMSPSPQQLARLGLTDADLVAVRSFNTRVHAVGGRHGGGGFGFGGGGQTGRTTRAHAPASRMEDGTPSEVGNDDSNGADAGLDGGSGAAAGGASEGFDHSAFDSDVDGSDAGDGGAGPGNTGRGSQHQLSQSLRASEQPSALSRDAIKRVAQRSVDAHKRASHGHQSQPRRRKNENDGGDGDGAPTPAAAATFSSGDAAAGQRRGGGPGPQARKMAGPPRHRY